MTENANQLNIVREFASHQGSVNACKYSHCGNYIMTASGRNINQLLYFTPS